MSQTTSGERVAASGERGRPPAHPADTQRLTSHPSAYGASYERRPRGAGSGTGKKDGEKIICCRSQEWINQSRPIDIAVALLDVGCATQTCRSCPQVGSINSKERNLRHSRPGEGVFAETTGCCQPHFSFGRILLFNLRLSGDSAEI